MAAYIICWPILGQDTVNMGQNAKGKRKIMPLENITPVILDQVGIEWAIVAYSIYFTKTLHESELSVLRM